MQMSGGKRSPCPVACLLDILGDKWTLLVVRDLLMGKQTYKEFQDSPEGIPSNILAERLKRLEAEAILSKQQYQANPVRYHYGLTDKGRDLGAVLRAMAHWGNQHVAGTYSLEQIQQFLKRPAG
jgi:DNA-binding HxlR family transcriptional regulator